MKLSPTILVVVGLLAAAYFLMQQKPSQGASTGPTGVPPQPATPPQTTDVSQHGFENTLHDIASIFSSAQNVVTSIKGNR